MLTADTASTGRHDPRGRPTTRWVAAVLMPIALAGALPHAGAQGGGVVRVSVALAGTDGAVLPVPRHALLVSDEPPTSTPRRIVTALDGTASIRLAPGTYTVESDQPVAFQGREYQWRQTLAVVAGQDARVELTTANAEAGPVTAASAGAAGKTSGATDAIMLWQDSVVALWTPTLPASGFVIDARGLVATSQQVVGASSSVEVQIGPTVKVSGRVLVTDRVNDVAVLWIDPAAVASIEPGAARLRRGAGDAAHQRAGGSRARHASRPANQRLVRHRQPGDLAGHARRSAVAARQCRWAGVRQRSRHWCHLVHRREGKR